MSLLKSKDVSPGESVNGLILIAKKPFSNQQDFIRKWLMGCKCGKVAWLFSFNVLNGHTTSCGCTRHNNVTTHGYSRSRIHNIWKGMKSRCSNPSVKAYPDYGGRGISYCDRWKVFENFLEDMESSYRDDLTLERDDVDGNYCKENCSWTSKLEQARNRRTTICWPYKGKLWKTHELFTLADPKACISERILYGRLERGWGIERALSFPSKKKLTELNKQHSSANINLNKIAS